MKIIQLLFLSLSLGFAGIYDDLKLDCDEILANKTQIFSPTFNPNKAGLEQIDYKCSNSLLNIPIVNQLLELAVKIRSESRLCVGNIADKNLNAFKFTLLKAGIWPEIYAKTLEFPEIYEKNQERNRAYFRYWGHQSISNFLLFKTFNKSYNEALDPLVKHYTSNFTMDEGSAIYYATKVANEFLKFAVNHEERQREGSRFDISDVDKRVMDTKFSKYDFNEMIYSGKISKELLQSSFNTALLYEKSEEILDEFIKIGVDLNSGYENSMFFALKNLDSLKFLLKNGANINYSNLLGQTPLFMAVRINDIKAVKFLIENKADVNARTIDLNTKLVYISNLGEMMPSYIKLCDFEHTSRTVLMEAALNGDVEILELLVENGADINAIDDAGFNALDYARMGKKDINSQYLKTIGLSSNLENR
ncbi:ankyrin repeat domain-containing protein [Campylobacter sp.]|uniref:ankyrin repeat domain-containing protein n=1 Tax=Campylobacter sp. TaxID=205 RepID=UPI0026F628E2|nr:ankyrin repeat domain-containing protein [Campylobacter sp.]